MTREKAYIQAVNIISNAEAGLKNLKQIPCHSNLQNGSNPFSRIFAQDPVFKNIEKQLAFDEI